MPQRISVDPAGLGCINIGRGICPERLRALSDVPIDQFTIDVVVNDKGDTEHLVLHGHHRAVMALRAGRLIAANLWEPDELPADPVVRLNLRRVRELHDTATICGYGTIPLLSRHADELELNDGA